tara:strand:- start:85 stop:306 length:222 start_codon:yes stop_codon:yes gene_type:complete
VQQDATIIALARLSIDAAKSELIPPIQSSITDARNEHYRSQAKSPNWGTAGNLKNYIDKSLVADLEQLPSCAL